MLFSFSFLSRSAFLSCFFLSTSSFKFCFFLLYSNHSLDDATAGIFSLFLVSDFSKFSGQKNDFLNGESNLLFYVEAIDLVGDVDGCKLISIGIGLSSKVNKVVGDFVMVVVGFCMIGIFDINVIEDVGVVFSARVVCDSGNSAAVIFGVEFSAYAFGVELFADAIKVEINVSLRVGVVS